MTNYKFYTTDILQIDQEGFRKRQSGDKIKDCLMVLTSEKICTPVLLTRPDLEETLVVSILRSNTGVVDIEGSRIDLKDNDTKQATAGTRTEWGVKQGGCSYEKGTGAEFTRQGRFPTNLILKHNENCCFETELCHKDCPIRILDLQSGLCPSTLARQGFGGPNPASKRTKNVLFTTGYKSSEDTGYVYGDSGGAARFFKQIRSQEELIIYLTKLTRGK